jgi:glutamate synthase (NADPH/NADH) small chain
VLRYGIPEFRLPKAIVDEEVEYIKSQGVEIRLNVLVGTTVTVDELFRQGFDAIFLGTGAGLPYFLGVPGENLNGVYSANEFLTRANLMKAYRFPEYDTPIWVGKRVVVVGGGNVAMDSARTALRLGAEKVTVVYRRSRAEMPARLEEVENAEEEGIEFMLLSNPVRILEDDKGWVKGMECIRMELGEADDSGRRRPIPVPGSEFILDVDTVISAVGTNPNPLLIRTVSGLALGRRGNVIANEATGKTNIPGIFAGGDIVTGSATVIAAMGAGKLAAHGIDEYIRTKNGRGM